MDISTLVGFIGCNALLIIVMMMAGSILMFWDVMSIVIVLGGSFFATMIRWPLPNVLRGASAGLKAVKNDVEDANALMDDIVELAQKARKESILALEKVPISNRFLEKAVKLMVDGNDSEMINQVINADIISMNQRHKDGRAFFENMGEATPAFGMIGTVIGLIVIMANLDDPNAIGPGLAVALVTTLYGAMIANMFFIPLAQKLKYRSAEELTNLKIIKAGVNSILAGENPRAIREKLESFL